MANGEVLGFGPNVTRMQNADPSLDLEQPGLALAKQPKKLFKGRIP